MEKNTPNERIKWILKQENCSILSWLEGTIIFYRSFTDRLM